MRLYLAIAVLMLALVAYTEAQEETIEQKLARFGQQMTDFGQDLGEKAKDAFEKIHTSEFAQSSRNWFQEQFEKAKAKFGELTN